MRNDKKPAASYADKVLALRECIGALRSERRRLTEQVRSRSEVCAILEKQVAQWSAEADGQLRRDLCRIAAGESVNLLRAHVDEGSLSFHAEAHLGATLVLLAGEEALRARLSAQLDAIPDVPNGPERIARIAAIDLELHSVETEEERLICEAEDSGEAILRRGDARPDIVLGAREVEEQRRHPDLYGVAEIIGGARAAQSPYVGKSRP